MKKVLSVFLIFTLAVCTFSACNNSNKPKITDVISVVNTVKINGKAIDTVEARMGAFQGKQGDYIEFLFDEPVTFDSFFINEKTTAVRQFNIYVSDGDKYKLIHTGKSITIENINFEPVTTTAIKVVIVNTEIGNDSFIIQGISAYSTQN